MTSCVWSLLFLSSLCWSSSAGPAGLKVRISDRAPDVLKSLVQDYLMDLVGEPVPDVQFKLMKGATCKIKGLTLTRLDLDLDKVFVKFQQDSGLQFGFRDLNFTVQLHREIIVRRKIVDQGMVNVTGKGVRAAIELGLDQNQGRLSLHIHNCDVQAAKMNMKFHQGLGPVLNRFKKLLQDQHKTNVCLAIKRHAVPKVNSMLANVTMVMSLSKDLGINLDYSLSGDVAVTTNNLDVPFTGVVYHGDTRPAVPAADVEPVFTDSTRMVYIGVSEDLFKSAAQALYSHGPLQLDLPQIGILPDYVLRTWGLPEGPVEVVLTDAPDISISPDGVSVHVKVITQSLVNPDLPPLPLTCQVCIQVDLDGSRLILQSLRPECTVEPKTLWGRFLATFVTSSRISSFIEELSADGFLLPLPDRLDLSQTKINYYPGFLVVGGDLVYPVQRSVLKAARLSPTSSRDPASSRKFQSVVFLVIMVLYICLCKRCC